MLSKYVCNVMYNTAGDLGYLYIHDLIAEIVTLVLIIVVSNSFGMSAFKIVTIR